MKIPPLTGSKSFSLVRKHNRFDIKGWCYNRNNFESTLIYRYQLDRLKGANLGKIGIFAGPTIHACTYTHTHTLKMTPATTHTLPLRELI